MNTTFQLDSRPEAMADVPGVCELPLTRAVVQYRDVHETDLSGGRIQDIGLALILEGRYASAAEAIDLGSADQKILDLSSELVVLDWAYEPTVEHARGLLREVSATGEPAVLERFSFRLALRVMERIGYGPLTRPTLLRIGFRDICRDLDLHEGTSVRIVMGPGRIVRAHLDYDGNLLVFRTATADRDVALEDALRRCFPTGDIRMLVPASRVASGGYQVRFPLPLAPADARDAIVAMRQGLTDLIGIFEPERRRTVDGLTATFGRRDTLSRIQLRSVAIPSAALDDDLLADAPRALTRATPPVSRDVTFGSSALH